MRKVFFAEEGILTVNIFNVISVNRILTQKLWKNHPKKSLVITSTLLGKIYNQKLNEKLWNFVKYQFLIIW